MSNTLLKDQNNPALAHEGLLVNFMDVKADRRVGPLTMKVTRYQFVEEFGSDLGNEIWKDLNKQGWLRYQKQGALGVVQRSETYGALHFDQYLEKYNDPEMVTRIMDILDQRVVLVVFGDNANLSLSVAKTIGSLLHPSLHQNSISNHIIKKLEKFLENQKQGYNDLMDPITGRAYFGWDETNQIHIGWDDGDGNWVNGYNDYLVNEFRDPSIFVQMRFDLPKTMVSNLGFRLTSYKLENGKLIFTSLPYSGSAFQGLGLDVGLPLYAHYSWNEILKNFVLAKIDYSRRNQLPGFLSESYTGMGTQYTGDVSTPDLAVNKHDRITDAPSLYSLGAAYRIAPQEIEDFLQDNWSIISSLFTDHGPWEGYNTTQEKAIQFQTTAHTLSLIIGGIGTGGENLYRYMQWKDKEDELRSFFHSDESVDYLNAEDNIKMKEVQGQEYNDSFQDNIFSISAKKMDAIELELSTKSSRNLSGGYLEFIYSSSHNIDQMTLILQRNDKAPDGIYIIGNEILSQLPKGSSNKLRIPLAATYGLENIEKISMHLANESSLSDFSFNIERLQFLPGTLKLF